MADGLEALGGSSADPLGGRIGILQLRMRVFERFELVHQRVELGVGDLRVVVNVVALFVMANEGTELVDALRGCHR